MVKIHKNNWMRFMSIFIVTPVYNRRHFTKNFLLALAKQSYKNFKTIIVDDGSVDGTADMISQEFPNTILLKEDGNLWWAEATNIGIRYALAHGATHIMTLNDDTIPEPNYMAKMKQWSDKKPNALIGALDIDINNGEIVYGGESRSWLTGKSTYLKKTLPPEQQNGIHEVTLFPGRGLLIPRLVFEAIGLFDSKHFPQTVADFDFTHRAYNAGFKIYVNYDARIKVYPEESATIQLRSKKSFSNYIRHLTNIKGGGNLKYFTICTLKNCPKRYLPIFLTKGILSRLVSYWVK